MPRRGISRCPAQKKNIHKIHGRTALRRFSGWGFTTVMCADRNSDGNKLVDCVRNAGPRGAEKASRRFGTMIANDWSRAGVDDGIRPKNSSKEAGGVLKPLALFSVYT